ncbi:hybrid sensor histidine kinase/response regulator [Tardiphaga robiniae]|uniref:histidine kinase n=1 Tax=Tardiphaga robiniae TaxID=943830 RepID=A0A7G6U533_9BRAD|nr:hybrid sensor histidine kinase/response regulator [Tardiphaga robiniae]QND74115.1 response regulator [Tardiphaga robiniae]
MKTEHQNSLRTLQWMMAASLALPLALFLFAAATSWVSTREIADREIERALDVAHEHALKVFETIDRSLSEMNEIVRGKSDDELRAQSDQMAGRLKQLTDALPQLKSVWVFDNKGRALVNSLDLTLPDLDFSDRDYYRVHIAGDAGTFIGQSLLPRQPYQGAPFFGVSRRRVSADGSFAGVVQASVFPEYFDRFYARIGHDAGSFFALGLTDGSILARYPQLDREVRLDPKGPVGRTLSAHPAGGLVTLVSPGDNVERRIGYRQLAGYPVYVAAGLETSAIRARWLRTISYHLIFGVPATALLFLLLAFAIRRTRRLNFEAMKRREAEEALKHGQRLEALGQLTGGVAHDFNNLLTVIRSSVDLLQRPDLSPDRRARYIAAISETVNRAAKLTAQLLAFARRQTLKPEVFDVGQCVHSVSEIIGTLTGAPIEIMTHVPDEALFVDADIGQFETALINIAVNARDAMAGEGRLTIAVSAAEQVPVALALRSDGYVAISVSDTGSGIPADQFEHIFEPFYTTKEVGQGTGLGLSQVFGFAKQSGGEVVVASELGKGSTFTLYLPRVSGDSIAPALSASEAPVVDGHGMSVLVVEDNRDVGTFAIDALSELGYTTVLRPNAQEALVELARHATHYDVVFSDVVMPGMTGIELAQEIRKLYPDLPVVLTSGYSHVLAQNGTFGFELLHKPYSIEQLSRVLSKAGTWRKAQREAV